MRSAPPLERPDAAALMPAVSTGLASSLRPRAANARANARCEATCTGSSWTATRRCSTASSKLPPSCSSLFPRPYRPKNPLGFLATICRNASRSIPPFISYQVSEKGGISENGSRHVSYHTRSQGMPGLRADFDAGAGEPHLLFFLHSSSGHAVLSGRHHPLHSGEQRVPERRAGAPSEEKDGPHPFSRPLLLQRAAAEVPLIARVRRALHPPRPGPINLECATREHRRYLGCCPLILHLTPEASAWGGRRGRGRGGE